MNNLTTRKIVLGMLMVLVLAFSVPGTADAITKFTKTSSTDYQVRSINEPFTITFSTSGQPQIPIKDDQDRLVTEGGSPIDSSGYPGTWTDHDSDSATPERFVRTLGASKVSDSLRYHYNDEAIGISVMAGTSVTTDLTLRKSGTSIPLVGDTRLSDTPDDTSASLYERAENSNRRLSGSLTGVAITHGVYTITINDITSTDDTPTGYTVATPITFTIYVWRNVSTSRGATISIGLSDNIAEQFGTVPLMVTLTNSVDEGTSSDYAKVEFEVTRGPGRLYEDKNRYGKADKSPSAKLTTFTNNLGTANTANVVLMPNRGTSHVRAWVSGNAPDPTKSHTTEAIYSYGYSQLKKVSGDSPKQTAPASSRLDAPFVVQLVDSTGRTTIPGADITFTIAGGGSLVKDPSFPDDLYNDDFLADPPTLEVETDSNGRASVFLVLGAPDSEAQSVEAQSVTATFGTDTSGAVTFSAEIGSADPRTPQTIEIVPGTDGQRAKQYGVLEKALTVIVRDQYGARLRDAVVEFEARDGGTISNPMPGDPGTIPTDSTAPTLENSDSTGRRRDIITDNSGMASIRYLAAEDSGAQKVTATLEDGSRRLKTFTINGAPSSRGGGGDPDPPPVITRGSLNIATSGSGNTRTVTVTASRAGTVAPGISVVLNVNNGATLTRRSGGTPLTSTLTLPATAGTYTLTATTTADYTGDSETITVTLPGTLLLALVGTENNGAHTLQVIVQNSVGTRVTTPVTVTLSGAGISRTVSVTGSGNVPIALPTTSGTLFARATGYNSGSITLPARTTTPTTGTIGTTTTTTTTTTTDDPPEPSRINIVGSATRSENTANQQLDQPLLVQVLDDDDDGVEDARVIFRVKTGQGRLSQRGNGRAIAVQTDARGHARATYTPMSASSTVEAEAKGVTRKATFTITTGAAPATDTTGTTGSYKAGDKIPGTLSRTFSGKITINGQTYTCTSSGECVISNGFVTKGQIEVSDTTTPGTSGTPRATEINPVVQVGAASRPPMLWVDGGAIYALVGKDVQKFVLSVDNALNIAVGGGKVYWTEKTGESGGTINSANLNGSGVTELASIFATPMGIAVDVTNNKLYWTNSAGRIQSANLDGSRITSVIPGGLEGAMDIALAGGNAYWTQGGNVRFVNLRGTKQIRNVSTGTDAAGSLVIGGGKVYWTEKTAASAGTINSANLNGTGVRELTSIRSVPMGIAVDTARSKLYWTASSGKIKRANLNGSGAKNVVSGLDSPSDMVLSNSIAAPAATPTTRTTTTASRSKYDVNGDGTVDNADAALVADAMGTSNTKYDVNGDGTVNFLDLLLVFDNRDAGAAGAPTIVGMKMSAAQIDIIEEQIDLLIATNDRSPAAMRTLIYLQQLLVTARPEKTQLLANYPNPFNPETWIPYELATDTHVRLTIYNTQGVVIRTLQFGHQSAGYYVGRDRAAYWDGRNAFGEQVASGLYFYQLETDEMSSMRKMVILK